MKTIKFALLLAALAAIVVGCGGGKPYDPGIVDNPPDTGFTLSQPSNQTVVAGDTAIFPITVTKTLLEKFSRSTSAVTLSVTGAPTDANTSFTVNPVTPTDAGSLTELHVATAPIGGSAHTSSIGDQTFTLVITGTDGTETHSVSVDMTVTTFVPDDFSFDPVSPQTVFGGDTAIFPVVVRTGIGEGHSRVSNDVTLSITGSQPGSKHSFSVNPVTPTLTGTLTKLRIKTLGSESGDFPVTITGTDGIHTHSVTTTLTVIFD